MAAIRSASDIDLDGLRFAMVSSTASEVDPSSPTIFDHHERDGMIWGEYEGGTVRIGRFVGTRAERGSRSASRTSSRPPVRPDDVAELIERHAAVRGHQAC